VIFDVGEFPINIDAHFYKEKTIKDLCPLFNFMVVVEFYYFIKRSAY
jgi:hypothetical protein